MKIIKTKQLNIRITEEDHFALEKRSRQFGFKNVSEYVRTCSLNADIKFIVEIPSYEVDLQ